MTIKKYRKKPIEIEAIQFKQYMLIDDFCKFVTCDCNFSMYGDDILFGSIETLEGEMAFDDGDYIIKGIKGEFYLCKSDIFNASYEEVGSDDVN